MTINNIIEQQVQEFDERYAPILWAAERKDAEAITWLRTILTRVAEEARADTLAKVREGVPDEYNVENCPISQMQLYTMGGVEHARGFVDGMNNARTAILDHLDTLSENK